AAAGREGGRPGGARERLAEGFGEQHRLRRGRRGAGLGFVVVALSAAGRDEQSQDRRSAEIKRGFDGPLHTAILSSSQFLYECIEPRNCGVLWRVRATGDGPQEADGLPAWGPRPDVRS